MNIKKKKPKKIIKMSIKVTVKIMMVTMVIKKANIKPQVIKKNIAMIITM